jgi:SNF family Na+-dependent transporter
MIGPILACLLAGIILILIGWIMGQASANNAHRRYREQQQHDALLRSIRQDLDSLLREQQRLATRLKP